MALVNGISLQISVEEMDAKILDSQNWTQNAPQPANRPTGTMNSWYGS